QGTSSKGKPFWSATATGYKYLDTKTQNGPVRMVKVQRTKSGTFQLKAKLVGTHGGLSIVPPNPGTDGCVAPTLTGGDRYSVGFGATSTLTNHGAKSFIAKAPTAETVCSTVPTTTTTTTTFPADCAAGKFLDVAGAPGPGGSYSSLSPSLSASCGASTVTIQ